MQPSVLFFNIKLLTVICKIIVFLISILIFIYKIHIYILNQQKGHNSWSILYKGNNSFFIYFLFHVKLNTAKCFISRFLPACVQCIVE
jgi:hypothetical protein